MKSGQRKSATLAAAGSLAGMAMLLVFRSVPIAAGTATAVIVAVMILKHLALAIVVGYSLPAMFRSIKPKIRSYCPFAKS